MIKQLTIESWQDLTRRLEQATQDGYSHFVALSDSITIS
jgi:hypothetical protein